MAECPQQRLYLAYVPSVGRTRKLSVSGVEYSASIRKSGPTERFSNVDTPRSGIPQSVRAELVCRRSTKFAWKRNPGSEWPRGIGPPADHYRYRQPSVHDEFKFHGTPESRVTGYQLPRQSGLIELFGADSGEPLPVEPRAISDRLYLEPLNRQPK